MNMKDFIKPNTYYWLKYKPSVHEEVIEYIGKFFTISRDGAFFQPYNKKENVFALYYMLYFEDIIEIEEIVTKDKLQEELIIQRL